ncbi:MAG: hypothetical protein DPW16_12365 [Chloroflexi bacterium]|nr:hypothetical protein [Chloroflexota bacterium]
MPTNFVKKKADRPARPESALDPVVALKKAVGERAEEMDIERITIDQTLQVRSKGLDAATVERYRAVIQNGGELPPITVYLMPTEATSSANTYLLAAGFHRMEAHKLEGRKTIFAVVRQGTREQAMIEAARSNLAHGLDLKKPDLRRALEILIVAGYYTKDGVLASNGVIAADLGVSDPTVGEWVKEIATVKNLTVDLTRRWGRDGKVREIENIREAATQRAEEERKRKEQERFEAQIAAEEEKLARYRASNVIFRTKFIADMILHTPGNRNLAARLKIDLPSENTPEEHKTFVYYLHAANRHFSLSVDRENQFIRDFRSHKDYRWYQEVLASITPSLWEQADAQNWTEDDMQQWLDGFKQRHSVPLPSAAPGMAQPKHPDPHYQPPTATGRHRLTEVTATEAETETTAQPSLDDCPFSVGQEVWIVATGELETVTQIEWRDGAWQIRLTNSEDFHRLDELSDVHPSAASAVQSTPPFEFSANQSVRVIRSGQIDQVTHLEYDSGLGCWVYLLRHDQSLYPYKATELEAVDEPEVDSNPAPCPFQKDDWVIYKPSGKHCQVLSAKWDGQFWWLHVMDESQHDFKEYAAQFEVAATTSETKPTHPFRIGDTVRDLRTGQLVEVVGFGSDGSLRVAGDDEPSQYDGSVTNFEKYDTRATPPPQAKPGGEYKPNGDTQARMVENYMGLLRLVQNVNAALMELEEYDCNLQYLQERDTLQGLWDSIAAMNANGNGVADKLYQRLTYMVSTGLPYDPVVADEVVKKGMQRT